MIDSDERDAGTSTRAPWSQQVVSLGHGHIYQHPRVDGSDSHTGAEETTAVVKVPLENKPGGCFQIQPQGRKHNL